MTITRRHHPFEGQALEVLRQARMPGGLQFVLILPDGSKSLIPADWTDFKLCVPSLKRSTERLFESGHEIGKRGIEGSNAIREAQTMFLGSGQ